MASIAQWLEILSEGRVVTAIDLPGSFHCDFFSFFFSTPSRRICKRLHDGRCLGYRRLN